MKFCHKTKHWMRVFVGLGSLLAGSITTNLVELLPITISVGMIYNNVGQILSRMINNKIIFLIKKRYFRNMFFLKFFS